MEIISQPAEVMITLEIKRKDTGIIETVTLLGHVTNIEKESDNGSDSHNGG